LSEDFFLKLSIHQYDLAHTIYQKLDDKVKNLLSIIMSLFPITIGIGYYLLSNLTQYAKCSFFLSLGFLIFSAIVGIFAYMPNMKIGLLNPKAFYDRHYSESLSEITTYSAVTIGWLVEIIGEKCEEKSSMLKIMHIFLLIYNVTLVMTLIFLFAKI
jgi:uncharacterized membrane protein YagU involved in acid resistance